MSSFYPKSEGGPKFEFKSFEIPKEKKKGIDYDRLLKKPDYKPKIQKYDKTSLTQEKTVSVLTKEDNFNKFDMPWISNLRVKDNAELMRLSIKPIRESTVPAPPSFYDEDVRKINEKSPKARNRLWNFNNVDFNVSGNTNELQHLIKPQPKGSPTRSELNFGFGLRKYNSLSNLQQEKAWKFPGLKGAKEAIAFPSPYTTATQSHQLGVATERGPFRFGKNKSKALKENGKYNDQFPQRNTCSIRHLFDKAALIGPIKWQSSLRWDSDKYKFDNRVSRKNSPATARMSGSRMKAE